MISHRCCLANRKSESNHSHMKQLGKVFVGLLFVQDRMAASGLPPAVSGQLQKGFRAHFLDFCITGVAPACSVTRVGFEPTLFRTRT